MSEDNNKDEIRTYIKYVEGFSFMEQLYSMKTYEPVKLLLSHEHTSEFTSAPTNHQILHEWEGNAFPSAFWERGEVGNNCKYISNNRNIDINDLVKFTLLSKSI